MLKTVLANVLQRHWGLVASVVMITAFSEYRHAHQVSPAVLAVSVLTALLVLLLTAVPLRLHKLADKR